MTDEEKKLGFHSLEPTERFTLEIAIHDEATSYTVTDQPGAVRWYNGALQQEWTITSFRDGRPVDQRKEWRAVPAMVQP